MGENVLSTLQPKDQVAVLVVQEVSSIFVYLQIVKDAGVTLHLQTHPAAWDGAARDATGHDPVLQANLPDWYHWCSLFRGDSPTRL